MSLQKKKKKLSTELQFSEEASAEERLSARTYIWMRGRAAAAKSKIYTVPFFLLMGLWNFMPCH